MPPQTLTINTRHFFLPAGIDIAELEHCIEDAARSGGAMITIPGPPPATTALITPATTVFFDATTPVIELFPASDQNASYDFDLPTTYEDCDT